MRIFAALFAFSLAGCLPPTGPELPPNVGADHAHVAGSEREDGEPEPAPEPVAIGTTVWANYHDTGFYFHGVVVERREATHRVLYDDGASEWLPADALRPDSLDEDAQIHVRFGFEGAFQAASVGRRLGRVLYVRLATGDERWTALPHIRFEANASGVPATTDGPYVAPTQGTLTPGADVFVNYQLQGLRFAGTITAVREDGHLHVVYLDGESEWIPPAYASTDDLAEGAVVHVRRAWEPPEWVRGRVRQRVGQALRVEFDDGGSAWTTLFRIRVPVDERTDLTAEPPTPEPEAEPAPEPERPRPRRRRRTEGE
jgi:hypothetical protein